MAIIITADGHVLDKKLTVQQGGAAIVGATSILGNTGITGDLGVTGDFGTSGGLSAGGGVSAGDDSSFAGDVSIDGVMGTLNPVLIEPEDESPPLVLGEQAQGQWVEGFNADLLDGLDSTDFMQRATNGTVSAVHTFSPVSVGPAFNLGANAKGQWVDGLNADYLDGLHGSSFLKIATAQTVTVAHTFNPAVAGAPFALGANALGYVVSGFNADQLDGLHKTDFLQLATAQTVTARHTFNPSVAGAPFTLGANALGYVVSGFNADQLDGNHASAFVTSGALSNYLALTGGTLSGDLNVPKLIIEGGASADWSIDTDTTTLKVFYGATSQFEITWDGKIWGKGAGADFAGTAQTGVVYAKSFNSQYYNGSVSTKTLSLDGLSFVKNIYGAMEVYSGASLLFAAGGEFWTGGTLRVASGNAGGVMYCERIYYETLTQQIFSIDTSLPGNDRWDILSSAIDTYQNHSAAQAHPSLKVSGIKKKLKAGGRANRVTDYEDVPTLGLNLGDLVQVAVECIAELKSEVDALKGA